MRVEVFDEHGKNLGEFKLSPGEMPARTQTSTGIEFMPDWEQAYDDEGDLRRCIACSCDQLYRHRTLPRVTGFFIVLALAMTAASLLGLASGWPIMVVMIIVLIIDVAILLWRHEVLVCYQCRTRYGDLHIASYHKTWSRRVARRIRARQRDSEPSPYDSA